MVKIGKNISISTKIFWMSIMTGVMVSSVFIFSCINIVSSIFEKFYQDKALSITNSLDAGIGINDLRDAEKLQGVITKFIYLNPDIDKLSISLVDENEGLVVVASNKFELIGKQSSSLNKEIYLNDRVVQQKISINTNYLGLKTVAPIILSGQKLGTYELDLSTERAWNELREKLMDYLFFISVFVVFASLMFYLMVKKSIIVPIEILISGVKKIGDGNLDHKIDLGQRDEIGDLAEAFNNNASKISDLYKNMEQKINERTESLNRNFQLLKEKNEAMDKNKSAMLNILEDDRLLEEALKNEKANVEKKVEERTRELLRTKARLDSSIQNLPVGFLMIDIFGKLVVSNSLANKIIGGDEIKIIERLKEILKDKVDLEKYIKDCGHTSSNLKFSDIEMEGKFYQILLSPIMAKEIAESCIGIVVLIQDITEAKILERSKDEFFSIASHELRTPLTAIRGNTSMILEYYAEAIKEPELRAMVDDIHESSIRLINIVNDFLNVSRLEQKRMEFNIKEFDLGDIIKETLKEYDVTGSRKKLSMDYDEGKTQLPKVMGDADKVRQVLINLVGNSLKFTEKGGVTISTEILDKKVKVLVSDTGRGIPLKQQNLLFHKFQQTGESLFTRDTAGGSGLGLYISRMMLEGMGGEVKLEKSEEGKGSTFSFTVPIATK